VVVGREGEWVEWVEWVEGVEGVEGVVVRPFRASRVGVEGCELGG
jgi:hypothetical protein